MRLNAKIFSIADGIEAVEKQEFDNRLVEVYYINDFPALFNQYLPKGRFAVWASIDGFNYRLFVEKGYYEKLGELYSDRVNKIWLDFWDKCDDVTKKYNYRIMLPTAIVCIVCFFLVTLIPLGSAQIWVQLGLLAVFIVVMMLLNKKVKEKINQINSDSVDEIKAMVGGASRFEELLKLQNDYIDAFIEKQAKLAEEEAEKEEAAEKALEENKEASSEEASNEEATEEAIVTEVKAAAEEDATEVTEVEAEVVDLTDSEEESKNN